jgi:DNA-binding transcriptional regulator YiaG
MDHSLKTINEMKHSRRVNTEKSKICIERGKRIKLLRMLVEMTRKDIDERYNLSQHTVHAWEKGTNCLTEKNADRLVEIFSREGLDITTDWLMHGTNPLFTKNEIGKNKDLQDALSIKGDIKILNEINYFRENNLNSVSVMVADEALLPVFCVGDYVGGVYVTNHMIQDLVGEFCIISTDDGQIYIRKIFNHQKCDSYMIGTTNPMYSINEPAHFVCNIQAAAKISRHWRLGSVTKSKEY